MRTPGQVAYETWRELPSTRAAYARIKTWSDLHTLEKDEWESLAAAVMRSPTADPPTRPDSPDGLKHKVEVSFSEAEMTIERMTAKIRGLNLLLVELEAALRRLGRGT